MMTLDDLVDTPGYSYLASPYTLYRYGPGCAAYDAARAVAELLKRRIRAISPIVHSHPVATIGRLDPFDAELWAWADQPFLVGARAILVLQLDGYDRSRGVAEEIAYAVEAGKPIIYVAPAELGL